MNLQISEKKFVCVDYPGIVQNHKAMLETLGGAAKVAKTYCDPSQRLELCFRPKDAGCRPLFANRQSCKGLLLRVRRHHCQDVCDNSADKQQKSEDTCSIESASERPPSISSSPSMFQYSAEVIGVVETVYKFQSLSDFQYLLADREPDGTYTAINDQVYLRDLRSRTWLDQQTPLCLLPPIFSRFDHPVMYCYREPPAHRAEYAKTLPKLDPNVIGVSRKRRPHHTQFVSYREKKVPTEPNSSAVEILQNKRVSPSVVDQINMMFEQKPIWSRSALAAQLSSSRAMHILSAVLPATAYYFTSGPWRCMWVRFGYDPRTDPQAKIYQTLDARVPRNIPEESNPVPKRSVLSYRTPRAKPRGHVAVIQHSIFDSTRTDGRELPDSAAVSQDKVYRFRPGVIPSYRQMFYQLCYVDEPDVQRLVHENDGQETECSEKDGWCLPETIDKCRILVTAHITSSTLQASTGTDERSTPARMDDGDSSGCDSEPNGDDDQLSYDEEQQYVDDDDEDDEDVADTAADRDRLEADVMKQLGLSS